MEASLGVRKGAWTADEDNRLRKCIEKYGEGKWHRVPLAAGLNRCRKSCRLRWLNYLRPNIKRGKFTADEVDLIIRLHKLLGNRKSCRFRWLNYLRPNIKRGKFTADKVDLIIRLYKLLGNRSWSCLFPMQPYNEINFISSKLSSLDIWPQIIQPPQSTTLPTSI